MNAPVTLYDSNGKPFRKADLTGPIKQGSKETTKGTARRSGSNTFLIRPDRGADSDWLPERDNVVAASKDLVRNNELIAGNVNQYTDSIVGRRFRCVPTPKGEIYGWTREQTRDVIRQMTCHWDIDSESDRYWMDFRGEKTFTQIIAQYVRTYRIFGEAIMILYQQMAPAIRPFGTAALVIDPSRLRTPKRFEKDPTWIAGIKRAGISKVPRTYAFSERHPADYGMFDEIKYNFVNRHNPLGRQQVIHSYVEDLPGITRGVPVYSSAIKRLKCLESFQDSTLDRAAWSATVAATLESEFSDDGMFTGFDEDTQQGYSQPAYERHAESCHEHNEENPLHVNGQKIVPLYNNQKLKLQQAGSPLSEFAPYERSLIKHTAAALNTPIELLTQDWSGGNFSQTRAGIQMWHRRTESEKVNVAERGANGLRGCWLEDKIAAGDIRLPGFETDPDAAWFWFVTESRDAISKANWHGPARMEIDRGKETKFYESLEDMGMGARQKLCNELLDCTYEELVDQQLEAELYEAQQRQEIFKGTGLSQETTTQPAETA